MVDQRRFSAFAKNHWAHRLPAALAGLVRIPSISPAFAPQWADEGHLEEVVGAAADWLTAELAAVSVHRQTLHGRSPALLCEIPASVGALPGGSILIYGHLDVQPAGDGWTVSSPFVPVRQGRRLFGRGAGDDKYVPAMVSCAVQALHSTGAEHPRIVLLMETSEESSSVDLPAYLDQYADLIGNLDMVICLDTFVPSNDRLWVTSSMRGILVVDLKVSVAESGIHSGIAGGIRPSTFRILRALLDRIEDAGTGLVHVPELNAQPPPWAVPELQAQAGLAAAPSTLVGLFKGVTPMHEEALAQLISLCWEPTVAYVGASGLPPVGSAGSVLRASTTLRLSIRIPPSVRAEEAQHALREALCGDPPYGASVSTDFVGAETGFIAIRDSKVEQRIQSASLSAFGTPAVWAGSGATIPFLAMIAARYPAVPVIPLGVLDPQSNPHGPDESIDLAAAAKLTVALAEIIAAPSRTP